MKPAGKQAAWERWIGPRGRVVLRAGGWSLAAKGVAAVNLFVALPFVLRALGPAEFGVWATLVSVMTFAGFLDFGIGNGAMNLIADARGRQRDDEVRVVLREATSVLVAIGAIMLACTAVAAWLPWWHILGLPPSSSASARAAAVVALAVVACSVPLSLATRAQLGLGQGHVAFRWQTLGQLFALGATIVTALAGSGLAWIVMASLSATLLPAVANALSLWRHPVHGRHGADSQPRRPDIRARIRKDGSQFFFLQMAGALAFTVDLPLITTLRGPVDAGQFAIVQRLFSVIPLALSLVWVPLWPVYRQALAAGDDRWVRRTLVRTVAGAGTFALLAATMIATMFHWIATLWLHHDVDAPRVLLAGFVAWATVEACGQAFSTFLNAAGVLRFQIATGVALAILAIGMKLTALSLWDASLVPWATVVAYVLATMLPTLYRLPSLMRQAHDGHKEPRNHS